MQRLEYSNIRTSAEWHICIIHYPFSRRLLPIFCIARTTVTVEHETALGRSHTEHSHGQVMAFGRPIPAINKNPTAKCKKLTSNMVQQLPSS